MEPEKIEITVDDYNELKKSAKILQLLRAHGVDNWDGWDFAMEEYNEDED